MHRILIAGLGVFCILRPAAASPTVPAEVVRVAPRIWIVGDPINWRVDWEYRGFLDLLSRTRASDAGGLVIAHSPQVTELRGKMFITNNAGEVRGLARNDPRFRIGTVPIAEIVPLVEKNSTPTRPFTVLGCFSTGCAATLAQATDRPVFGVAGVTKPAQGPSGGSLFLGPTLSDQFSVEGIPFNAMEARTVLEKGEVGGLGGWSDEVRRGLRDVLDHPRSRYSLSDRLLDADKTWYMDYDAEGKPLCFAAGTPVATEQGSRAIEDIKTGDRVWAFDRRTGRGELRRVLQTSAREGRIHQVRIRSANGTEDVRTTVDHPFLVPGIGWVLAARLAPGTPLMTRSGAPAFVVDSRSTSDVAPVFNLEVEGLHAYFAGATEIVVHNGPCPEGAAPKSRGGIPFTPGIGTALMTVAFAMHVRNDGLAKATYHAAQGMVVWEVLSRGVIGLAGLAGQAAGTTAARLIPIVGELLIAGDIALMITNWSLGTRATWGDVWNAYTGHLDRPTMIAGPPPPLDQNLYFD